MRMGTPRTRGLIAASFLIFFLSQPSHATTIRVPGDQPTIQAAIDAAVDYDEIIISDGVYTGEGNKNLDLAGKAIKVRSEFNDPARCIIDCEGQGRGFYFHSSETPDSVITGLTITHGYPSGIGHEAIHGGAIKCIHANPTITDCLIIENAAECGGGMFNEYSYPTLINCTFRDNSTLEPTDSGYGGAVYNYHSSPTLLNCRVIGNTTNSETGAPGGGMYNYNNSNPILTNCTFIGNSVGNKENSQGGALYCAYNSNPILTNCILWDNSPNEIAVDDQASQPSNPIVTYSNIQGGEALPWFGTGCIDADPAFLVDGTGYLSPGSPCIDAGTNNPDQPLPPEDADHSSRVRDGNNDFQSKVDMGAFEFNPETPRIVPNRNTILFSTSEDEAQSDTIELAVSNAGGQDLNWTIAGIPSWLSLSPTFGTTASCEESRIRITTNPAGLDYGTNTALLEITDPLAPNSPRVVRIIFNITGTFLVPSEYSTIQEAIDATILPGDIVEIADGIYTGDMNKNLDFGGKSITVRSASADPTLCIIDCERDGRGVYFHNDEGPDAILTGLTISNGYADYNSECGRDGGGICCIRSKPTITNCRFENNSAYYGGGLFCVQSNPTIRSCSFCNNSAEANGGGMNSSNSGEASTQTPAPGITDCEFIENEAAAGGGLSFTGSDLAIKNSSFIGNSSENSGGGLYNSGSGLVITSCLFEDNYSDYGGAMTLSYSDASVFNCIINGNSANCGGGIYIRKADCLNIANCTIIRNKASGDFPYGGGIYNKDNSYPTLTNCILTGNTPDEFYNYSVPGNPSIPDVTHSLISGGMGQPWFGSGCIDADPMFVSDEDIHLMPNSPGVDSGTNGLAVPLLNEDYDGTSRILDGNDDLIATVDMGAYEYDPTALRIGLSSSSIVFFALENSGQPQPQTLRISNAGGVTLNWVMTGLPDWLSTSASSGSVESGIDETVILTADNNTRPHGSYTAILEVSDPQAVNSPKTVQVTLNVTKYFNVPGDYPTIQEAIDAAVVSGDIVEIADGTYTGEGNKDLDFGGKAITVKSSSGNPERCIIECEESGRGFYFNNGEGSDSIVSGLSITHGYAAPSQQQGAGIYCHSSSPTINHCIFDTNQIPTGKGGGIYFYNSKSTISHCTFKTNNGDDGGAIAFFYSDVVLDKCIFTKNTADQGGALYLKDSDIVIKNCTFNDNSAFPSGGAIYNFGSNLTVTQCIFSCNRTTNGGAIYNASGYNRHSDQRITNCTFHNNFARSYGGAIFNQHSIDDPCNPILANCIFWENTPSVFYNTSESNPVVTFSLAQDSSDESWFGTGCIDADPLFANPTGPDGDIATGEDNDYHLSVGSPCIDHGLNEPAISLPDEDLDGDIRLLDGNGDSLTVVDMGVYEHDPDIPYITLSQNTFVWNAFENSQNPEPQSLLILNTGGIEANWSVTGQPAWLSTLPNSGVILPGNDLQLTLQIDTTNLERGEHNATLEVSAPQANHVTRMIQITLYVAGTINVPDEFSTIQAAIDEAVPYDVVRIADGTYTGEGNKNLSFNGKPITVSSASGDPYECIIDCENSGRGFLFNNDEEADSILSGLTITNGRAPGRGGGIYCRMTNPTITNCRFINNTAIGSSAQGGGLCTDYRNCTLRNCVFIGNSVEGDDSLGGGVYADGTSGTYENCTFSQNSAGTGGGLFHRRTTLILTRCLFNNNTADEDGGGLASSSHVTLVQCEFNNNSAGSNGGGIYYYSYLELIRCTINGNSAADSGGGMYGIGNGTTNLDHCLFANNFASNYGGGMYNRSGLSSTNCLFINNTAAANGGSMFILYANNSTLTNCIMSDGWPQEIYAYSPSNLEITHSDIRGISGVPWLGEGCIDANPEFVDPDGPDDDPMTFEDNDYRLLQGSPCIDAGSNTAVPADTLDLDNDGDTEEPTPLDYGNQPRFLDDPQSPDTGEGTAPIVDMGIYEYEPILIGDLDLDDDVDLDDFALFTTCLSGPRVTVVPPGVDRELFLRADMDLDYDVDLQDFSMLQKHFLNPE